MRVLVPFITFLVFALIQDYEELNFTSATAFTGLSLVGMLSSRNRFSQDMSIVDKELPFTLIDLVVSMIQTIMGAILIYIATSYFAFTLPPVVAIVWGKYLLSFYRGQFRIARAHSQSLTVIQKFYLRTSRQVRLLDLEAKSPLYTHFIESLSRLGTIRVFGWSEDFVDQNLYTLDNS